MKTIKRCILFLCICFAFSFETEAANTSNKVVSTAEVISGGDLLISKSILSGAKTKTGVYDFEYIFDYVDDYIKDADYAVVNLETSIAGKSKGYCGFPRFNTPESIIPAAKKAGFDMFLTASNHSYDCGYNALLNKINCLKKYNVNYIGTRYSTNQYFHKIVNVNGINIGMLNYTRETGASTKKKVILNSTGTGPNGTREYVIVDKKGQKRIASYNEKYLDEFYATLKNDIATLKKRGADIIVAYPHWGREYNTGYDPMEDEIAQKMCDYGVDVIIGGHPHVVEPVKVYTSSVSGKTTVCIHSTGNFVSSMRGTNKKLDYVEDGALFKYTVKKYADGTVAVTSASVLPIWVKKTPNQKKYTVIPLDKSVDWKKSFNVSNYSTKVSSGYQSYKRTTGLVSAGLKLFNKMPKIAKQPKASSVKAKKTAVFSVKAVGNGVKYQWQYSSDGGKTWKNSSGKGNSSFKLSVVTKKNYSGRYYRCRVKTSAGTVYSKKAKLTVK